MKKGVNSCTTEGEVHHPLGERKRQTNNRTKKKRGPCFIPLSPEEKKEISLSLTYGAIKGAWVTLERQRKTSLVRGEEGGRGPLVRVGVIHRERHHVRGLLLMKSLE